jgi:hypothetical protein
MRRGWRISPTLHQLDSSGRSGRWPKLYPLDENPRRGGPEVRRLQNGAPRGSFPRWNCGSTGRR